MHLDFVATLSAASGAMRRERQYGRQGHTRVSGDLVELGAASRVAIIGDVHGDSVTLQRILRDVDYAEFLADPENKLIFLGDYVDRGSDSIGVLYTLATLKAQYSDSVILLKGNHESPVELPFASHDLPDKIEARFGPENAQHVYRETLAFFDLLSLAAIIDRCALFVHGGLPVNHKNQDFRQTIARAKEDHLRNSSMEEILWNDPRELGPEVEWERSRRGYGKHFGSAITKRWLEETATKVVVRGHEPCMGFKLDHDAKVLTLFSSVEAYPKFKASYVIMPQEAMDKASNARDFLEYIHVLDA